MNQCLVLNSCTHADSELGQLMQILKADAAAEAVAAVRTTSTLMSVLRNSDHKQTLLLLACGCSAVINSLLPHRPLIIPFTTVLFHSGEPIAPRQLLEQLHVRYVLEYCSHDYAVVAGLLQSKIGQSSL